MNEHETQKRAEITKELRTARRYLIGVGILMVMMDLAYLFIIYKDQSPPEVLYLALGIDGFILVAFTTLGILVSRKPRFCMIAGLVLFWLIAFASAYDNPKALTQGILVKILFTMALWKGLQSASKAQLLRRDLERVFE